MEEKPLNRILSSYNTYKLPRFRKLWKNFKFARESIESLESLTWHLSIQLALISNYYKRGRFLRVFFTHTRPGCTRPRGSISWYWAQCLNETTQDD